MQENRSFDHYLGTLGGVRGYHDRITIPPRNGRTVWQQTDGRGVTVMPFLMDGARTASHHLASLPHSWDDGQAVWNHGFWDRWVPVKGQMTMAGYRREDVPFHHALADAFTVCDAYHCSIPSSTNPNRSFLMSGTIDPEGRWGGPMFRQPLEDHGYNLRREKLFSWKTYPERLEAAGIDWRIYQGLDDGSPFEKNALDAVRPRAGSTLENTDSLVSCFNLLRFFQAYEDATSDSPLYQRAMARRPSSVFAADAMAGTLPAVSYVLPPASCSEHPDWTPADGASFIAFILDALTANPQTWSRTALFIMYDENDGFFDHVLPPSAPGNRAQGLSNVDTTLEIRGDDGMPYGLGARVPMFVVSPWSRGGAVCSQVFDHTSVIRFLETRFGVHEPNISPWRRAVCGDLTAAFDFTRSDPLTPEILPDTRAYRTRAAEQRRLATPEPPARPSFPAQQAHRRLYRPLPYDLEVGFDIQPSGSGRLVLNNSGEAGAVLHVFDLRSGSTPRRYTVASKSELVDDWICGPEGEHDLYVIGPAGFLRHFVGHRGHVSVTVDKAGRQLRLTCTIAETRQLKLIATDMVYGGQTMELVVPSGGPAVIEWPIERNDHWYDLKLTAPELPGFWRRYAGHVETGRASLSDPALVRRDV